MKKTLIAIVSALLLAVMSVSLVGCGKEELNFGKECVKLKSQLDALTQLKTGSVDVAVIDSVMAGYYTSTGDYKDDLMVVPNEVFAEETYGIAAKKGNQSLIAHINDALIQLYAAGEYADIATNYGLTDSLYITGNTENPITSTSDNSWADVVSRGEIVIGYTVFAPIAFEENDTLVGFDIHLAKSVAAVLSDMAGKTIEVEFQEINWNAKETLLENGTIDLVWNGMTITEEREENMCISIPYLYNKQVAVIRKADIAKYTNKESMKNAVIGVEGGSAGEGVVIKK